jgi:hypothetical protein
MRLGHAIGVGYVYEGSGNPQCDEAGRVHTVLILSCVDDMAGRASVTMNRTSEISPSAPLGIVARAQGMPHTARKC